jgi:hypothetical protein
MLLAMIREFDEKEIWADPVVEGSVVDPVGGGHARDTPIAARRDGELPDSDRSSPIRVRRFCYSNAVLDTPR